MDGTSHKKAVDDQSARRPRVLVVSPHLTRTLGGITAVVRDILRSQLADEFSFRHIASQSDELNRAGKILLAVVAFMHYAFQVLCWRPRMVFIHVGGNASMYRKAPFIVFGRVMGCRVLTHFHAGDFDHYFHRQSRCGKWLIMRALGCSHSLIACSRELQRILRNYLPDAEIVVLPNWVEISQFAVARQQVSGDAENQLVRLLFVGAMGRLKGEKDLVDALARVRKRVPHLRAMMLGHGAETISQLCREKGIADLIEHCGPVSMEGRAGFFKKADFFVLPSYAEGMPVSVIEAMAAGLPVITTPVGGIPDLITDGVEGWLIDPGDVGTLAERIVGLAGDAHLRQKMGEQAVLNAARFDRRLVLEGLAEILHRTIDSRSPAARVMMSQREEEEKSV